MKLFLSSIFIFGLSIACFSQLTKVNQPSPLTTGYTVVEQDHNQENTINRNKIKLNLQPTQQKSNATTTGFSTESGQTVHTATEAQRQKQELHFNREEVENK